MPRMLFGVLTALFMSVPAFAQVREIERSAVPRDLADRLIGVATDPATVRYIGTTDISADSSVQANVVVVGSLRLEGRVEGELIVVDGDVELAPESVITGDLTVVGGEVSGADLATINGTLMAFGRTPPMFPTPLPARVATNERGVPNGVRGDFGREGSSRFTLDLGPVNRIEGVPIELGPAFSTGGKNPFRTDVVMIVRTEGTSPFQTDRIGYRVEAEQLLGGRRQLHIGGGVFSEIVPIESWGVTDRESGWSTFLFTSDQRDYLETRGARVYVRVTPRAIPLDVGIELRDERSGTVAPGDPWSVVSNDREWRRQPLVAEGSIRSLVAHVGIDTRDNRNEPGGGWWIQGTWQEGVSGELAVPTATLFPASGGDPVPAAMPSITSEVSRAFLDIRQYNSVGPRARLNFRGVVGGSRAGEILPPQFQYTLGGPGTLPGYPAFAYDCGARGALVTLERDEVARTMHPFYGCDRFALFQAEYRGGLGDFLGFGAERAGDRERDRDGDPEEGRLSPRWVVFFDAGRAWAEGDWGTFSRMDSPTLYDAGIGILTGGLGIYWAKPLSDGAEGSTLTVRMDRRF